MAFPTDSRVSRSMLESVHTTNIEGYRRDGSIRWENCHPEANGR